MLPLSSQVLYFSATDYIDRHYDIFELDLSNCNFKQICDNQNYWDFAIRPVTQEWVQIEWVGLLGWYNMDFCNRQAWGGTIKASNNLFINSGQESDKYGHIWLLGPSGIVKVNPPGNLYEFKGPIDIQEYNVGKATFLDGKYYSTGSRKSNVNKRIIIEFDTLYPLISRVVGDIPVNLQIQGIFSIHKSCGHNKLVMATEDELYEINITTGDFTFLCSFQLPVRFLRSYYGSSPWMYNPQDCDVFIDLDINNSSGDQMNGFTSSLNCTNPFPFLSDDDPDVFSDYGTMDSIVIQLLNPIDGNAEQLQITQNFGSLYRTDAFSLSLIPSLLTTNDSFELAIRHLKYMNTSCIPSMGARFIRFIAYKNQISDTAYATIHLNGPFYHAGMDNTIALCKNDTPINLQNYLGPCYSPGGTWSGPTHLANDLLDPASSIDGTYYYIVGDSICGYDSAQILINIWDPPLFSLPSDTSLCLNNTFELTYNIPNSKFLWSDGDTTPSKFIRSSGTYWLSVTNASGCTYLDTFSISFVPLEMLTRDTFICQDHTIQYGGNFYKPGEKITDTLSGVSSCDTILTWNVRGLPIPLPALIADTLVCPNQLSLIQTSLPYQIYSWSNSSTQSDVLVSPGTYTLTVTDYNGCSNSSSITISQVPPLDYQIISQDPRCFGETGSIQIDILNGGAPGFHYFLNGSSNLTGKFDQLTAGKYTITITDAEACMVQDTVYIQPGNELLIQMKQSIDLLLNQSAVIPFSVLKGSVKDIWSDPSTNIRLLSGNQFEIITSLDQTLTIFFADDSGCVYSIPLIIKILRDDKTYFPNVFSPNGDHINDHWIPYIGPDYKFSKLSIFDRWGNLIYHSMNEPIWDGRNSNGQIVNPGVYLYSIHLLNNLSEPKFEYGDITLVK